jgi:hypothetical protein
MNDKTPPRDPSLNPALRERREEAYDTTHPTPPPADSASVQREEGVAWPAIWAIVTLVCVAVAVYIIFF